MQIVIDISKQDYNAIVTAIVPRMNAILMQEAIANGTPLPQGHGRLLILDEESVEKYMFPMSFSCQKRISEVGISNSVVTIIGSDTESED